MKKILIVDDDKDVTSLLAVQLSDQHYSVDVAVDAIQATRHMRKSKPDLLILDVSIPAGSAFTIVDSVRTVPEFFGIPYIFLTKNTDPELKKQALSSGAKEYITKPYDLNHLLKVIRSVLALKIDKYDL